MRSFATTPPATSTRLGTVKLAGDLAGNGSTADTSRVADVQGSGVAFDEQIGLFGAPRVLPPGALFWPTLNMPNGCFLTWTDGVNIYPQFQMQGLGLDIGAATGAHTTWYGGNFTGVYTSVGIQSTVDFLQLFDSAGLARWDLRPNETRIRGQQDRPAQISRVTIEAQPFNAPMLEVCKGVITGTVIAIGVGADFTSTMLGSGDGVIYIRNRIAAPTTNPTNGGVLYPEGGALKWRGSAGTVTTIAPP